MKSMYVSGTLSVSLIPRSAWKHTDNVMIKM